MKSIEKYLNNNYTAFFIFICIALIFCMPIFKNFNYWGVEDWDEYFFRNGFARETILKHHQFPLWNPYTCGGNVFLAHPTASFLSPLFIPVLLFGEVKGLKIEVIVYLIIGLFGMFLLSRHLKLKGYPALIPSFVYMLSAIYPLHVTAGLVGEFTMAFVPYIFLFYIKSLQNKKYIWLAILFLSLMILGGNLRVVFIFPFLLFIYSIFLTIQSKKLLPIKMLCLMFVGAFLLTGIKTLPMTEFFIDHPYLKDNPQGVNPRTLFIMLFQKVQYYSPDSGYFLKIPYDWCHCGAYIGIMPFLLFILGVILCFRSEWPLILSGLFLLLISMAKQSPVNLWKIVHAIPGFSSLHSPPRFILGFIFTVSLISGIGLSKLENVLNKNSLMKLCIPIITIFILIDLITTNSYLLKEAFTLIPQKIERSQFFYQEVSSLNYLEQDSDIYPRFLSNKGTLNAEEVDNIYPVRRNIKSYSDRDYRGEAYLLNGHGKAEIKYFSPNRIIIETNVLQSDFLLLNQNYYKGWRIREAGRIYSAMNLKGLIATNIFPIRKKVEFFYLPNSFILGCITSLLTLLVAILSLLKI